MNQKLKNALSAALVFIVATAFTIFCGISIGNMTGNPVKETESKKESESVIETSAPESSEATVQTLVPLETDAVNVENDDKETVIAPLNGDGKPQKNDDDEYDTDDDYDDEDFDDEDDDDSDASVSLPSDSASASGNAPVVTPGSHISSLDQGTIDAIRASSDNTVVTYYTMNDKDSEGYPSNIPALRDQFNAVLPGMVSVCNNNQSMISLSFLLTIEYDNNTNNLLDLLSANNTKATFFADFAYASAHPDIIQRIINEGHELGSLGYAFPDGGFANLSLEAQAEDLAMMHNYIADTFGYTMKRFYYGYEVYSLASMALVTAMGYQPTFYSINYIDYSHDVFIDANVFLGEIQSRLHKGALITLHTVNAASIQVIPGIIQSAQQMGLQTGLIQ